MTIFLLTNLLIFTKTVLVEHGTPPKAAEILNKKPNLSLYRCNDIHNVKIFAPDLYCNIMLHFQFHPKNYN